MHYLSLASSSTYGNSFLVVAESGDMVMIDVGLGLKRTLEGINRVGLDVKRLKGIFVTHEHGDHTRALMLKKSLAERLGVPLYAPRALWRIWGGDFGERHRSLGLRQYIEPGSIVSLGDISVDVVEKPHDSVVSQGYIVSEGEKQLAVLTDLGYVSDVLVERLQSVQHLILESNHDVDMQLRSERPYFLIQRVLGDYGHLSNEQAGELLARLSGLESVLLAHLSMDCNSPRLARSSGLKWLEHRDVVLEVAPADHPSVLMG